jgi:hypothetical protein
MRRIVHITAKYSLYPKLAFALDFLSANNLLNSPFEYALLLYVTSNQMVKILILCRIACLVHSDFDRGELVCRRLGVLWHLGVLPSVDNTPKQVVRVPVPHHLFFIFKMFRELLRISGSAHYRNFMSGLWIRIRIGSAFSDFVDPDPYWESGSGSKSKKIKKFHWKKWTF